MVILQLEEDEIINLDIYFNLIFLSSIAINESTPNIYNLGQIHTYISNYILSMYSGSEILNVNT